MAIPSLDEYAKREFLDAQKRMMAQKRDDMIDGYYAQQGGLLNSAINAGSIGASQPPRAANPTNESKAKEPAVKTTVAAARRRQLLPLL